MKTAGESTGIRDAGKIPFRQLGDAMLEAFEHLPSYYQYYPQHDQYLSRRVYLDAAAKYIRVLKELHNVGGDEIVWGERGCRSWENILTVPFEAAGIAKSFKIEKKKANPDKEILHLFTLVKWRIDAGWWDNDNYQEMCDNRY